MLGVLLAKLAIAGCAVAAACLCAAWFVAELGFRERAQERLDRLKRPDGAWDYDGPEVSPFWPDDSGEWPASKPAPAEWSIVD